MQVKQHLVFNKEGFQASTPSQCSEMTQIYVYINSLVQDHSNSYANTLELLQSFIKPSICSKIHSTPHCLAPYMLIVSPVLTFSLILWWVPAVGLSPPQSPDTMIWTPGTVLWSPLKGLGPPKTYKEELLLHPWMCDEIWAKVSQYHCPSHSPYFGQIAKNRQRIKTHIYVYKCIQICIHIWVCKTCIKSMG